jgi:hypothetical protein
VGGGEIYSPFTDVSRNISENFSEKFSSGFSPSKIFRKISGQSLTSFQKINSGTIRKNIPDFSAGISRKNRRCENIFRKTSGQSFAKKNLITIR